MCIRDSAGFAQRMMDDIIDLEMEKIDAILEKINSDPENEEIKHTERHLWEKIRKKTLEGRRTGAVSYTHLDVYKRQF